MTSSFIVKKLAEDPAMWTYSLPNSPLGGMEDRYLRLSGECHPDFLAMPIGTPEGAKMCVRKLDSCGRHIGGTIRQHTSSVIEDSQGYRRGSVDMYDVHAKRPEQRWNPQYYSDRRIPWEQDLLRADYIHWPIRFSGTGIETLRIPLERNDGFTGDIIEGNGPYFQYAYAFTPEEDRETGMRTATSWSDTVPPPKYDVTRLHQPYPIWKREHEQVCNPQDWRDTVHQRRIV